MNLFPLSTEPDLIEIAGPHDAEATLPSEDSVKLKNYRLIDENLYAYTATDDIHTSPSKGKLMPRFDAVSPISPPRARILELLRPEDPGREALEAIVRPAPRRGLTRPFDEDTRRFLQRALHSPSNHGLTLEPHQESHDPPRSTEAKQPASDAQSNGTQRSLAEELREAEEDERSGNTKRDLISEYRIREGNEAAERDRLGRLALSVEEDETAVGYGLSAAARKLDALLEESRALHDELAGIHQDMQAECARAGRCSEAARALAAESLALHFLDDVVALLRGDVTGAVRARSWPFALGPKRPGRNYVV